MKQTQNNLEQFCPVCTSSKCTRLKVHFYNLYKCSFCSHIFSSFPEKSCEGHRVKFLNAIRQREKHFLQSVTTKTYRDWRAGVEERKLKISRPYINKNTSILDCNIEDATFLKTIRDKVKTVSGLCRDQLFSSYWTDVSYLGKYIQDIPIENKFDIILLVDSFEFCYGLYENMIECFRFLNPGGHILIDVPINNNPVKNYQARYHEFSTKSSLRFTETIKNSKITYHNDINNRFASIVVQSSQK